MHFSTLFTTSAIIGASLAADHIVQVSDNSAGLFFKPENVQAAEGDTVTFKFWPKNHSVAQATFAKPCEPMANGFWSGYIPSTSGAAQQAFQIEVTNASRPIWFYCTQGKHCQGGMVGVINGPSSGNTIEAFKTNAKAVANNVAPSGDGPVNGQKVTAPAGNASGSPSASSSGSPTASSSGTPTASGSGGAASSTSTPGAAASVQAGMGAVFAGFFAVLAYAL